MIKHQNSFSEHAYGSLYLVPTPIGNLEDITYRALRILKEADLIAAEDTRQTRKLLTHFDITTALVSYHEHNKNKSGERLLSDLQAGKTIALVSDAGMPCISDPGYDLVQLVIEEEIAVIPLPGANAALTALIASGLPTEHFYYYGFLNRSKKEKKAELENLSNVTDTLIFYESPHRLKETLSLLRDGLGNRDIVITRELTKKFEEFLRGSLDDAVQWVKENTVKGEFCLIVKGADEEEISSQSEVNWWSELTVKEHVEHYIKVKEMKSKDAIKSVAKDRNLPKREVYQVYHID